MATTTAKRVKNHAALTKANKDNSPKWDGSDAWSGEKFTKHFRDSMMWYSQNKTSKDLKPQVINWMAREGFTKETIAQYKKTKDSRSGMTMCALASCMMRGMPALHPEFNNGKDSGIWLKAQIMEVINTGDFEEERETTVVKVHNPIVTIQDRIREQAGAMAEEIDIAIDSFITNPEAFDPKQFSLVKVFRGKGVKSAHARYIKGFYEFGHSELLELASGQADEQLREAYKHLPRKHVKKLIEFYQIIMDSCDQISAEAKINKKPRAKKVKPAEDLVKKLKFKTSDDKLGIVSVPPGQIIKSQSVLIYNVKTRKMGYYIAKNLEGLSVKGTTLENFTEKSVQKTLRKPLEQLKELKELNTQKRVENWFDKVIKTTAIKLNGRLNEDTVILKVFK